MALKEARQAAGLTQKDLSDKSGVDQSTVSNLETGRVRQPAYDTAVRLARALNTTPEELFPVPDLAVSSFRCPACGYIGEAVPV